MTFSFLGFQILSERSLKHILDLCFFFWSFLSLLCCFFLFLLQACEFLKPWFVARACTFAYFKDPILTRLSFSLMGVVAKSSSDGIFQAAPRAFLVVWLLYIKLPPKDWLTISLAETTLFLEKLTKFSLGRGTHTGNSRSNFSVASFTLETRDRVIVYHFLTRNREVTLKNGKR